MALRVMVDGEDFCVRVELSSEPMPVHSPEVRPTCSWKTVYVIEPTSFRREDQTAGEATRQLVLQRHSLIHIEEFDCARILNVDQRVTLQDQLPRGLPRG